MRLKTNFRDGNDNIIENDFDLRLEDKTMVTEKEQKEFVEKLNSFFNNPLITEKEKQFLMDKMEQQLKETMEMIKRTTNGQ